MTNLHSPQHAPSSAHGSAPQASARGAAERQTSERLALDALRADLAENLRALRRAEADAMRQIARMRAAADRMAQSAGVALVFDRTGGRA